MRDEGMTNGVGIQASVAEAPDIRSERITLYRLLATLLREPPSHELLEYLCGLEDQAGGAGELGRVLQLLGLAARSSSVAQLDDEFHELFIGLGRGELVPYGSWYLTGYLMEQPLGRLRNDLAALGFSRTDDTHEPEDHVAALLEVMSLLADGQEGMGVQARFFNAHLAGWLSRFFDDLEQARTAVFYRAVARLGALFSRSEEQLLGD
jgi:TorA maturation chaperone TorD